MSEIWISKKEFEARLELDKQRWVDMLFGKIEVRTPKEDDNVKLAYVIINGKREMIGVDNKTLKGYKLNDEYPTWKLPLEEISYDSFERWCTTFDV
jgi:hypothetical protein